jgi:hypothetical protein
MCSVKLQANYEKLMEPVKGRPVVGFGISGVKLLGSASKMLRVT